jgi:hypothetical protein
VYGYLAYGPLKGVPLGGLVGDQQGALIGNKCLTQGKAKCTYGTGVFLLFCMGTDIVTDCLVRCVNRDVSLMYALTTLRRLHMDSEWVPKERLSMPWKEPVSERSNTEPSMLCK